jgi:glycerol-3-phosphate dehydrogenase
LTRSRPALRAAFALDKWIGRHRNDGLEPELHLPPARLLSKTATLKLFPGIRRDGLTGGAQWYDYQMIENDRLTFAFATAADRAGADLANHVEVRALTRRDGRFSARLHDSLARTDLEVEARAILNAAGARAGTIMTMLGISRAFPLVKALNLVTSKPAADIALAAADANGRMLTLVPWRGRAIVGTGQFPLSASAASDVTEEDVERFIADANHAFPALKVGRADVTLVHRGLVPGAPRGGDPAALLGSSEILDHSRDGAAGAITIVGAKYTTARATAERAVNLAARKLGRPLSRSRTAVAVLPGAGIADHEALAIETARDSGVELPLPLLRHLVGRYAEAAATIVRLMAERPDTAAPLSEATPTIAAEVVHAIRNECAPRLADIVLRRTTLGAAGRPGADALHACAGIAARELGWDRDRVTEEVDAVERVYLV